MTEQSKGANARLVMDWETSFGTPKTEGKLGKIIPFKSETLDFNQDMAQDDIINGTQQPDPTSPGDKKCGGDITVPLYSNLAGYLFRAAFGAPTSTTESASASNVMTGTPTITIAGGTGGYTFSAEQATPAVGDRIIYEKSGTRYIGYITTKTNTTTGVLQTKRTAGSACADVATATVIAVMQSKAAATPGTVGISTGVATFSAAPSQLTVGTMVIYLDGDGVEKFAWISVAGATPTLIDATGAAPADIAAAPVAWVGVASTWKHVFKIHNTAELPSLVIEKAFLDFAEPYYILFFGMRVSKVAFSFGEQGKLLATFTFVGKDITKGTTAYDASAATVQGTIFYKNDASAKEGGTAITSLRKLAINLDTDLSVDNYCLGGGGALGSLPSGKRKVNGSIEALFIDTSILVKALGITESSLEVNVTPAGFHAMTIKIPELQYTPTISKISSPKGILLDPSFDAHYIDGTEGSAMVIELTNAVASLA